MADNYRVREWSTNIDKYLTDVDSFLDDTVETFFDMVADELIDRSPVDTGLFRGNWQVTGNEPPMNSVPIRDKDGAATKARSAEHVRQLLKMGAAVRSIHFSNMLIYANALEYGHSQQAPLGVVGISAARLGIIMQNAIADARRKNAL